MSNRLCVCLCAALLLSSYATALADDELIERKWFLGVGAHPTHHGYLVRAVTPDSPAYKANIYRGDYITSVNGLRVGYLPERKYRTLDTALNATDGNATIKVRFTCSGHTCREFEAVVPLSLRAERKAEPTTTDALQINTVGVPAGQDANLQSGKIEDPKAGAKPALPESQPQAPRDRRGVLIQVLNPVLPDDDDADK